MKENGVWKLKVFDYRVVWQADYDAGWAHSETNPLMVAAYKQTYPENPKGPDEIVSAPAPRWPRQGIHPFHYPHPVTGEWIK